MCWSFQLCYSKVRSSDPHPLPVQVFQHCPYRIFTMDCQGPAVSPICLWGLAGHVLEKSYLGSLIGGFQCFSPETPTLSISSTLWVMDTLQAVTPAKSFFPQASIQAEADVLLMEDIRQHSTFFMSKGLNCLKDSPHQQYQIFRKILPQFVTVNEIWAMGCAVSTTCARAPGKLRHIKCESE